MAANLDMKKTDKALYTPPTDPVLVNVPPMHYLMIDGQGNPNTAPEYQTAIETLYPLAYGVRAICKADGQPFTVMPLEGLWWFETGAPIEGDENYKDKFIWTLMIRLPDFVTEQMVEQAKEAVAKKKLGLPLDQVRYERYEEGLSAQIMHIGPYSVGHLITSKVVQRFAYHSLIRSSQLINSVRCIGPKQKGSNHP